MIRDDRLDRTRELDGRHDSRIEAVLEIETPRADRRRGDRRTRCHIVEHLEIRARAGEQRIQSDTALPQLPRLVGFADEAETGHVLRQPCRQMPTYRPDQSKLDVGQSRRKLLHDVVRGFDVRRMRAAHEHGRWPSFVQRAIAARIESRRLVRGLKAVGCQDDATGVDAEIRGHLLPLFLGRDEDQIRGVDE